jgi:hypothetical protein
LVITNGDVVTCTFTNTRKTGSLQIFKNVVPDDPATNWDFGVTGPTPFNCSIAGDGSCTAQTVFTGNYTIVETAGANTNLDDYTTTYACTVNGGVGPSGSGTTIDVPVGKNDAVVCTYTNTRQQATLTLQKTVINDNGGTATVDDFQAYIGTTEVPWDVPQTLDAGPYTVSEDVVTGYSAGFWGGDCASDGTITLTPGQMQPVRSRTTTMRRRCTW